MCICCCDSLYLNFALHRTQLCINTAIVYMHRFYMFHSFTKFNRTVRASRFKLFFCIVVIYSDIQIFGFEQLSSMFNCSNFHVLLLRAGSVWIFQIQFDSVRFFANVNSRSRSLFAVARPSLVCLSVVCL